MLNLTTIILEIKSYPNNITTDIIVKLHNNISDIIDEMFGDGNPDAEYFNIAVDWDGKREELIDNYGIISEDGIIYDEGENNVEVLSQDKKREFYKRLLQLKADMGKGINEIKNIGKITPEIVGKAIDNFFEIYRRRNRNEEKLHKIINLIHKFKWYERDYKDALYDDERYLNFCRQLEKEGLLGKFYKDLKQIERDDSTS